MMFFICFISAVLFQISSAQLLSVGQSNLPRTISLPNNGLVATNGISGLSSLPLNSVPAPSVQIGKSAIGNVATNLAYGNSLASGAVSANLVGNNFANRNLGASVVNANVPINIANGFNINTGTFATANTGLASLLPAGRPCGIQISADALEVGGSVGVNGQMPFYATVNVNGNLPSSGSGVVNCACGGQ